MAKKKKDKLLSKLEAGLDEVREWLKRQEDILDELRESRSRNERRPRM